MRTGPVQGLSRSPAPQFKVGDRVWLNPRNIRMNCPSRKLDVQRMGQFRIEEVVGESQLAYRLQLLPQMRIHPVFHVSLLEPYKENRLVGRTQERPPQVEVEGELEYEVKELVDRVGNRSGLSDFPTRSGPRFLVSDCVRTLRSILIAGSDRVHS